MANGITALPFPTCGGGKQQGITPIQMQAGNESSMFPSSRGPVRRAPAPTDKEIYGPLAPIAIEGLMSLFGKDEQSPDDYLKSVAGLTEEQEDQWDEALRAKTIKELDDVERAKWDAWRIYGAPTERDTFGLDELAHIAGAVSMDRGGPGYAQSYLNLRGAKETDRLTKETKRQAYINQLLAPVDRAKEKVFDPVSEQEVYVNYNKRSGKFEPIEGLEYGEDFDINLVRPTIDDGTYANPSYYHLPTFNRDDVGEAIFTSKVNNKTGDVQIRMKDGSLLNPGDPGYSDYVPTSVINAAGEAGYNIFLKPQATSLVKSFEDIKEKEVTSLKLMKASNEFLDIMNRNIASGGKLNPLTATSTAFAFINHMRNNLEVATKNIFGDQNPNTDRLFSKTLDGGFREDTRGLGVAAKQLHNEFAELDNLLKDYEGNEKETNNYIRGSIDTWIDTADLSEVRRESLRKTFRGMQADQMRMAAIQIQMAYTAAAINGQTGRTLSDKDLAYHLQMIGFNGSNDLPIVKNTMLKFMDSSVAGVDITAGSKFSRQGVASGVVDIETPAIFSLYKNYYNIPENNIKYSDEFPNGIPIRGTDRDNPYGVRDWTLKSMYQRNFGNPIMNKYLGFKGERISEGNIYDRRLRHPEMYQGYEETPITNNQQIDDSDSRRNEALGTGYSPP